MISEKIEALKWPRKGIEVKSKGIVLGNLWLACCVLILQVIDMVQTIVAIEVLGMAESNVLLANLNYMDMAIIKIAIWSLIAMYLAVRNRNKLMIMTIGMNIGIVVANTLMIISVIIS